MPIIRRNNCICATLRIFNSVWMTVQHAGCVPDSHPHRVTNTKCRIDTVISPDDGHIVTQNMNRKEIYILRKIVHQVGFIYMTLESIFTVTVVALLTNCLCGQFGARVILSSNHFNLHRWTRNSTTRPDEMSCSYYPY